MLRNYLYIYQKQNKPTFDKAPSVVSRRILSCIGLTSSDDDPVDVRGLPIVSFFSLTGVVERFAFSGFFGNSLAFPFFVSGTISDSMRSLQYRLRSFFYVQIRSYRVFSSFCTASDRSLRSKILLFVVSIRSRHPTRVKYYINKTQNTD